jgi:hypothetical protein
MFPNAPGWSPASKLKFSAFRLVEKKIDAKQKRQAIQNLNPEENSTSLYRQAKNDGQTHEHSR